MANATRPGSLKAQLGTERVGQIWPTFCPPLNVTVGQIWPTFCWPFGHLLACCPLAPLAWELANVNICKPKRNPSPPEFWHPNEESVAHLAAC